MNFIEKIILFIKKVFNKDKGAKMIAAPEETFKNDAKTSFVNSLKINVVKNIKKKKVETLILSGDGLGIDTNVNY